MYEYVQNLRQNKPIISFACKKKMKTPVTILLMLCVCLFFFFNVKLS